MRRDGGQEEGRSHDAEERERRRAEDGHAIAEMMRQIPRRAGPDEKTDPEGDADHRECARALLRRSDVGDVRLRDGEISRGEAVDDPREKDNQQIRCVGEHQESREGPHLADGEHRLAPDAIGDLPEHRAGDQLAERVGADQQAHHAGAGAEVLRVEGQERKHDGEAEHVHHHDQEDGEERRLHGRSARSRRQASASTSSSLAKQKRSSFSPARPR